MPSHRRSEARNMLDDETRTGPAVSGAAEDEGARPPHGDRLARGQIQDAVDSVLDAQPVLDMHTHVYPPRFGTPVPNARGTTDPSGLMLWGVDELVTYHYLIAEVYRVVTPDKLPYEQYCAMSNSEQADHIGKPLFVEPPPISEACRGILTTLQKLSLDPAAGLPRLRRYFAEQDPDGYVDHVMELT